MANAYKDLCMTPQDPIAKPPSGYATGGGTFNGEKGIYPKRDISPLLPKEKIYDNLQGNTPTDETRGTKA